MNGIEHYEAAERLLSRALMVRSDTDSTPTDSGATHLVAAAQVHATLALAAATALVATQQYVGSSDEIKSWSQVIQATAFERDPCAEHCMDDGHDGCYPRCVDRMKATTVTDNEECPF